MEINFEKEYLRELYEDGKLTTQTAMLFEAALGISAGLLMKIQLDYNMFTAKQDSSFVQRLESIRKYAAML